MKIDLEKLICSILESPHLTQTNADIRKALEEQGLKYENKKIQPL